MAKTASEYKQQFKALLPPGKLWESLGREGSVADRLWEAKAQEYARIDRRVDDLLAEANPLRTVEMLPDWEEFAGLPDVCTGTLLTVQQRRNALVQKLTSVGGQSRAYFVGVAAALGYEITIDEFEPHTCETACDQPIYDEDWRWTWRVNAAEQTIIESTCESPCNEPLRVWGNELLECTIERLKPAHTNVLFGYGG
ncbi:MAG: phage tail protein [Desulfobulbaceae bacterium]|nr:MAG: phage tail protein [Desulfobulbaceae bacterium]